MGGSNLTKEASSETPARPPIQPPIPEGPKKRPNTPAMYTIFLFYQSHFLDLMMQENLNGTNFSSSILMMTGLVFKLKIILVSPLLSLATRYCSRCRFQNFSSCKFILDFSDSKNIKVTANGSTDLFDSGTITEIVEQITCHLMDGLQKNHFFQTHLFQLRRVKLCMELKKKNTFLKTTRICIQNSRISGYNNFNLEAQKERRKEKIGTKEKRPVIFH